MSEKMNKHRKPSRIVCAALRSADGKIVCGARHWDNVMRNQLRRGRENIAKKWISAEQGFIDQYGVFFTREDAWKIASENNQIINLRPQNNNRLYSEDLY